MKRDEVRNEIRTDLDNVELQNHRHSSANFVLKSVHLETHALEYHLGSARVRHLLEYGGDLRVIQSRRGKKHVELRRQQPQRGNVELACLERREPLLLECRIFRRTSCIMARIVLWMLTRLSP